MATESEINSLISEREWNVTASLVRPWTDLSQVTFFFFFFFLPPSPNVAGLLQEESAEQCSLLLPPSEELPDRPHQPQPLPALPAAEVLGGGHVARW